MKKVCIIIRVYNRIQDLEYNLEIIRRTWSSNEYYIIVTCNGESDGFVLTDKIYSLSDKIVKCSGNNGHLKGNSKLLLQALPFIPSDCYYTLLLEADTWVYKDALISKYIHMLEIKKAVWASAKWYDRFYSLATDFAIVNSEFLIKNEKILDFGIYPETYVASYLFKNGESWIYIKENMPVQIAGYISSFPYAPYGRFYVFPFSNMVTHHIEHLSGGMEQKIKNFNALSNNLFDNYRISSPKLIKLWMKIIVVISLLIPRRSWFGIVEYRDENRSY